MFKKAKAPINLEITYRFTEGIGRHDATFYIDTRGFTVAYNNL
jgi:hypothetical protein